MPIKTKFYLTGVIGDSLKYFTDKGRWKTPAQCVESDFQVKTWASLAWAKKNHGRGKERKPAYVYTVARGHRVVTKLEKLIVSALEENGALSLWGIANNVYNGCMNNPNRSNGARIASIRKACDRSTKIIQIGDEYDCTKKLMHTGLTPHRRPKP